MLDEFMFSNGPMFCEDMSKIGPHCHQVFHCFIYKIIHIQNINYYLKAITQAILNTIYWLFSFRDI